MALSLKVRAHCEIGLVRTSNQDSAYVSPTLIAVADGMGGAAAGDMASAVAINELRRADEQNRPGQPGHERLAGDQMLEALGGALAKANDVLADLVAWDHSMEGMGTTVCGAMFSGSQYGICHIGDSRGYLLRDGQFRRLTHDHSWVQSLVDDGKIAPEDAATHPHRSLLLKVLNGQSAHTPDFKLVDAELGDRLLFCSDGLSGMVEDDAIEKLLTSSDDLDQIVAGLTEAAHQGGGLDNITIVLADVVAHDEALDAATPTVLGAAETVAIPEIDRTVPLAAGTAAASASASQPGRPRSAGGESAGRPGPSGGSPQPPAGVIDPDRAETIRYTPHLPSRGRRWIPLLTAFVLIMAVLAAGFFGGRAYLATQFFIGPDTGRVAIFQGAPDEILGRPLWTRVETSPIRISDLPPYYAGKVVNQELRYGSLGDAREEMSNLGRMAQRCIAERAAAAAPAPATPAPDGETPAGTEPAASPTDGPTPDNTITATSTAGTTTPGGTPLTSGPSSISATPGTTAKPSASISNRPDLEACG